MILVMDISSPRNQWPLGRITNVNIDRQGLVRSATVKMAKCKNSDIKDFTTSSLQRPIVKIVKLCSSNWV